MTTKLQKHIAKGDKHFEKISFGKALKEYRQAQELDPENPTIYERLIETHKKLDHEWTETDFSDSLAWTMKLQELKDPRFKRVNARATPEWRDITEMVKSLLQVDKDYEEEVLIEKIAQHGSKAIYPLIDTLMSFKEVHRKKNT